MKNVKTAIIDIGSNTIRLVVYNYDTKKGLHEMGNMKVVARLRNYVLPSGEMTEEGIQVLEDTLSDFVVMLKDFEVTDVKAAATAAVRQAVNREAIIERIKKNLDLQVDILTEQEEAFYGFTGVAYSLATPSAITIDIGGGSTEITLFKNKELIHYHSFPFGTVSLKQMFVEGEVLTPDEQKKLVKFVHEQLATLSWVKDAKLPIIAIGGSARNVAQIHQYRKHYPISGVHGYEMYAADLKELNDFLGGMSYSELKNLDGLSTDRADIIVPALAVFRELLKTVGSDVFQLTKKGLREGLIIERILETEPEAFSKFNVFEANAKQIAWAFGRSEEQVACLLNLSEQLYRECCKLNCFTLDSKDLTAIARAAKIYAIGEYIELSSASQHTFYLIANQSIDGLSHVERIKIALLASYKNKEHFYNFASPFESWMSPEELHKLRDFGALLKFANALNISKRSVVQNVWLVPDGEQLCLNIALKKNGAAEKYQAERHKKHLERVVKKPIVLNFIEEGLE